MVHPDLPHETKKYKGNPYPKLNECKTHKRGISYPRDIITTLLSEPSHPKKENINFQKTSKR